jgi:hypothetical protein
MNDWIADSGTGGTDGDQPFYENLIADYLRAEGYIRRDWLEESILERLLEPKCRYVLLVAEPGAGKTGVMTGLADRHPEWLRYFIRRDSTTPLSEGDAVSALIRIGHQFAARQPALFDPQRLEVVVTPIRVPSPAEEACGTWCGCGPRCWPTVSGAEAADRDDDAARPDLAVRVVLDAAEPAVDRRAVPR